VLRALRRGAAVLALGAFFAIGAAAVLGASSEGDVPASAEAPPRVAPEPGPPPGQTGDRRGTDGGQTPGRASSARVQVRWRRSVSVGLQWRGRLVRGVQLPAEGPTFFTWDPILRRAPNRAWRRWGNDRLVRALLRVLDEYAAAHPEARRVGVGDLSRPHGGDFGPRFGLPGHVSHQNGLDVDVYYPRRDGRERAPDRAGQIDRRLAQDLVDRFVAAGAIRVFVGPRTGLTGPPAVVQRLVNHDNHLHARFAAWPMRTHRLGRSLRGRPIQAFALGDPAGATRVLVVGCIHGDECAGIAVTRSLARLRPPPDVDLWVVPNLNPDGLAAGTRQNAHGVDLNRNFPGRLAGSGKAVRSDLSGPRPLSEREARIAVRLILRLRPRYTIWFHQPQSLVRGWDGSRRAAGRYARLVGMRFRALPSPPGAASRWQHRRLPASEVFIVELPRGRLSPAAARRHARAILALAG
jgi:Penicillin-insensitive murein endopeptidase/Succinylglutamate desuccinylase / Aspartoacylase family